MLCVIVRCVHDLFVNVVKECVTENSPEVARDERCRHTVLVADRLRTMYDQ